jgi:hypothetical protein
MTDNEKPRTAVEIAMARMKQRDADSGVVDLPPTAEQKAAIAEARNLHAAKLAEGEILHRSRLMGVHEPADRTRLEDVYRDDVRRLNEDLDRKVQEIRRAGVE